MYIFDRCDQGVVDRGVHNIRLIQRDDRPCYIDISAYSLQPSENMSFDKFPLNMREWNDKGLLIRP